MANLSTNCYSAKKRAAQPQRLPQGEWPRPRTGTWAARGGPAREGGGRCRRAEAVQSRYYVQYRKRCQHRH